MLKQILGIVGYKILVLNVRKLKFIGFIFVYGYLKIGNLDDVLIFCFIIYCMFYNVFYLFNVNVLDIIV